MHQVCRVVMRGRRRPGLLVHYELDGLVADSELIVIAIADTHELRAVLLDHLARAGAAGFQSETRAQHDASEVPSGGARRQEAISISDFPQMTSRGLRTPFAPMRNTCV